MRWWTSLQYPYSFADHPWGEWFWDRREDINNSDIYVRYGGEWPTGWYEFFKIYPSNGHGEQLAFRSPETRKCLDWDDWHWTVHKDVIYILTLPGDTPNWAGAGLVAVSPPCSNWYSQLYMVTEVTRSQTSALRAAVQDTRELSPRIRATVAKTSELPDAITASIQGNPEAPIRLHAAVRGEASRDIGIKAAVRTERGLVPGIEAAVAKTDELPITILATVQGYTQLDIRTRAAIKGEAQKSVGIIANVVVSRVPQIYLEMENLVPQELDLRSTPNWPSKVKDWRKDSIGK